MQEKIKHLPFFELEISVFKNYLDDIAHFIEKTSKKLKKKKLSDDFEEYEYEFKPLLNSSTFITIMSFVESNLNLICKNIKHANNYDIDITDLSGNGIKRTFTYIEKAHNKKSEINNLRSEIKKFEGYSTIRNKIVHENGYVIGEGKIKNIKDIQKMIPDLELKENPFCSDQISLFGEDEVKIRINKKFLHQLINDIVDLFEKLNSFI